MKNNLLIVGATSGIMIACLESFINKKYKIFATYSNKKSLSIIPDNIKKKTKYQIYKVKFNAR
jgi:NADP-dependent 3-hydroxy acid dehydrogenase YdfG